MRQYNKHYTEEVRSASQSTGSSRLRTFLTFVDEKEEIVKSRWKRRKMERISMSYKSTSEVGSSITSNNGYSQSSSITQN